MQIVYLAGPYRAKTIIGILLNILKARRVAKQLWKMGYAVICPHSNSGLYNGVSEEIFLIGDLHILKRCDFIVVCGKWQQSKGTLNEIAYAEKLGMSIIYWDCVNENELLGGNTNERNFTNNFTNYCNTDLVTSSFADNK